MSFLDWFRAAPTTARRKAKTFSYDAVTRAYHDGLVTGARQSGPNSEVLGNLSQLSGNARYLLRNNPHARAAVNHLVDGTIGTGLVPRFGSPRLDTLWERWVKECYVGSDLGFYGLQDVICRAWRESGEVLVRRRWRRPEDGLSVPLQLEVLECDYLDTATVNTPSQGGRVVAGVEFDAVGRRSGYWLYYSHPSDYTWWYATAGLQSGSRLISAADIAHLYTEERPGQVRGVTHLAAIIEGLRYLADLRQAKLIKLRAEARIVGGIETPETDEIGLTGGGTDSDEEAPTGATLEDLGPATVIRLLEGEKLAFAQQTASPDYEAIVRMENRAVAAGAGTTYEQMTGDLSTVNYSSYRAGLNAARLARTKERENILIPVCLDKIVGWWVEAARLAGSIGAQEVVSWQWSSPRVLGIDKEQSDIDTASLANGTTSEIAVMADTGKDWRQVLAARAEYRAECQRLGLPVPSATKTVAPGAPPAQ